MKVQPYSFSKSTVKGQRQQWVSAESVSSLQTLPKLRLFRLLKLFSLISNWM